MDARPSSPQWCLSTPTCGSRWQGSSSVTKRRSTSLNADCRSGFAFPGAESRQPVWAGHARPLIVGLSAASMGVASVGLVLVNPAQLAVPGGLKAPSSVMAGGSDVVGATTLVPVSAWSIQVGNRSQIRGLAGPYGVAPSVGEASWSEPVSEPSKQDAGVDAAPTQPDGEGAPESPPDGDGDGGGEAPPPSSNAGPVKVEGTADGVVIAVTPDPLPTGPIVIEVPLPLEPVLVPCPLSALPLEPSFP